MKLFAYISIFLIVHSTGIFASEKTARTLREKADQSKTVKAPVQDRGKQYNPVVKEVPVPKIPIGQIANNPGGGNSVVSDNSSSFSESNSSGQSQGGSQGLGKQLQNLAGALAIKSPPSSQSDDSQNNERKLPPGNQGGGTPPGGQLQDKPLWMPMCFFFDPETTESYARETIKTVVDDFAGCGIAVQVHSATIRHGYDKDNPDSLNAAAKYHCPWQNISGDDVKYGATQTHPDSYKASDKMCDPPEKIKEKEAGRAPWDVAGCAAKAEGFSIVDKGAGGATASHEEGHAVAQNSKLENLGEDGIVRTDAGRGLQLVSSPQDKTKKQEEAPEGTEGKSGYTPEGCQALRSGANDNSQRKVKYNPNGLESYYHQEWDPEKMVDFHATGKPRFFAPKEYPNIVGKEPPRKPNERALAQDQSSPSGNPLATAEPGHKKPLGQVSRGTEIRSGDANTVSGRVAQRGGDNSPDAAGSAITGSGVGAATGNNMIVANPNAKGDGDNPNTEPNSSGSNSFASSSGDSSSGSGGLNGSGESSGSAGASDSSMASRIAGKKSDSGGLNDATFFEKSPKLETANAERKPRKSEPVDNTKFQIAGKSPDRNPASNPSEQRGIPKMRLLQKQLPYGGDGGV